KRLWMRNQVQVCARRRPVPERSKIGDSRTYGNGQPAAPPKPAERLGAVWVRRDDYVRPVRLDQPEEPRPSHPGQRPLWERSRRAKAGEQPEAEVPEPAEAKEDDSRRGLAHRGYRRPHRGEPVLGNDVDTRLFCAQLGGERAGREIMPLP